MVGIVVVGNSWALCGIAGVSIGTVDGFFSAKWKLATRVLYF